MRPINRLAHVFAIVLATTALSILLASLVIQPATAAATNYYVSPTGSDSNPGTSAGAPFKTIQKAVDLAQPGSTITLAAGNYLQDVRSKRNGTAGAPIAIVGPATAIVKGAGAKHIFDINHDYLRLEGFTIDGLAGDPNSISGYRKKLLYVLSKQSRDGVTGLKVLNMAFRNAADECVRLRYFAQNSEIARSSFIGCGVYDFRFNGGGRNGEAIYIGTAPEQLGDGTNPTSDPDQSNGNWIHHNTFDTRGSECVDIKEASSGNLIENNDCTGQRDPESGGFGARGSGNIFRYNHISENSGAGIRLGGDTTADGINSDVYGNTIRDNRAGGIKFQQRPQGRVCGNTMSGNAGGNAVGTYGAQFNPTAPCADPIPTATTTPPTRTPLPATTESYRPTIDTYVNSGAPSTSYANADRIKVDGTPEQWSLLRFDLRQGATPQRAQLRLYVDNSSNQGGAVYIIPATWDSNVTWASRPALGIKVADIGRARSKKWITVDVTNAVGSSEVVTLAIIPRSDDATVYRSSESSGKYAPELIVER